MKSNVVRVRELASIVAAMYRSRLVMSYRLALRCLEFHLADVSASRPTRER